MGLIRSGISLEKYAVYVAGVQPFMDTDLQMSRDFKEKSETFMFFSSMSFTGNLLGVVVETKSTTKSKHSETTVPLQLVGQEWKPVSKLTSQVDIRS